MSFPTNTSPYGQNNQFQQQKPSFYQALFGRPEQNYQQPTFGPQQQGLFNQLTQAGQGRGAGGAFGQSADYYRDLLSNDSQDYNAFAAPQMRQFREQIVPDIAEQFAGMGSGGLSSSGFRNAAVNAGADLSERLGAIRAQLRQQGAQGLQGIGQAGLGSFYENIHRPETFGLLGNAAEGLGKAAGTYLSSKIPGFGVPWGSSNKQQNPTG
jgi:hypothetical protein